MQPWQEFSSFRFLLAVPFFRWIYTDRVEKQSFGKEESIERITETVNRSPVFCLPGRFSVSIELFGTESFSLGSQHSKASGVCIALVVFLFYENVGRKSSSGSFVL